MIVAISVLHFSIHTQWMFWHDLLRRAYYLPIVWAIYLYGFRGGLASSLVVAVVFTVHLLTGWGHQLGSQWDQVYDIGGYLAVGAGVGYVVDRARRAAVTAARLEWDLSLRGILSAAITELKGPKTALDHLSAEMVHERAPMTWEHAVGMRLQVISRSLARLRRDLSGTARILSSRSFVTSPRDWAQGFAADPNRHGLPGFLIARTDAARPPPPAWPIPGPVLDEMVSFLLREIAPYVSPESRCELTVSSVEGSLAIGVRAPVDVEEDPTFAWPPPAPESSGLVQERLFELTRRRFRSAVQRHCDGHEFGFRLILSRPTTRLPTGVVRGR